MIVEPALFLVLPWFRRLFHMRPNERKFDDAKRGSGTNNRVPYYRYKHGRYVYKNGRYVYKNGRYVYKKRHNMCTKTADMCTKTAEYVYKNGRICTKTAEYVYKTTEYLPVGRYVKTARTRLVAVPHRKCDRHTHATTSCTYRLTVSRVRDKTT